MRVKHVFGPVYDSDSKILILGSFPSIKSREKSFYYMNIQNRFWSVLTNIYNTDFKSLNIEEKITKLKVLNIALYDVIEECEINASSDSSIKNVKVSNLKEMIDNSRIIKIYLNGKKAYNLFMKYFSEYSDMAISLPSTSPANAKYSLNELILEWKKIRGE